MKGVKAIRFLLMVGLMMLAFSRSASADSISGLLDFNYTNATINTKDIFGVTSKTKSDGFQQRYSLAFDKMIYPSLIFTGGGLFEDNISNGNTDGVETKSNTTRLSPYVDLKLANAFISSGIGFRRREDSSTSNGVSAPKQIQDMYTANFGWRPSDLPSIDVFFTKRFLYDSQRTTQNIETDNYTWTSNYRAIKGLELNYNGNYSTVSDMLRNTETLSLTNSGRVSYSGSLLNNRVLYHAGYNIAMQNSTITANGGTGGTFFQAPLTAGSQLFAVTPTISTTVDNGALTPSTQPVNLVAPLTPPATQNNIGLTFSTGTQIDTIFLSITSALDTTVSPAVRKPPTVADLNTFFTANSGLFPFKIYTSQDGISWGPLGGITPATVTVGNNPGNLTTDEVGFIITFPLQSTTFIKVVQTPPLVSPIIPNPPPTIDPRNILVANIQVFKSVQITTPGKSIKSSSIGGIYDMNVKALLLDDPNLTYDMSFSFNHNSSDQGPMTTSYIMNNGLSLAHRLSDIFSTTARVTDEYSEDTQGKTRNAISYNASLAATPLPTLNHSVVYGGRVEFSQGQTSMTNSIYLNNSAELYRGLSLNLGAGYSTASQASGQNTDSISVTVGSDIVPNKDMSLSLSFQDLTSHQTGGGQPDKSSFNRAATATATYRPFEAVYLTAGFSVNMQDNRATETLQNYAVSWSPFRGGDLQFSFAYSQNLNSSQNEKDTNISPSVRWNIRPGSTLDVSYNNLNTTSSSTGTTTANSFGAHLRIAF